MMTVSLSLQGATRNLGVGKKGTNLLTETSLVSRRESLCARPTQTTFVDPFESVYMSLSGLHFVETQTPEGKPTAAPIATAVRH